MCKDKWSIDGEDEDNDDVFKHDEDIERFLNNPDAIISFFGCRFIFEVEPGCITNSSIADVEEIVRDTAIDYEYPLYGIDVTTDRIEIKIEVSVNEAPLDSAERFQKYFERAGIITELIYIGTFGKEQSTQ